MWPSSRVRRSSVRTYKLPIVIGLCLILGFFILRPMMGNSQFGIISPIPDDDRQDITSSNSSPKIQKDTTELVRTIKELIDKQKGSYSVYVQELDSGRSFGLNETTIFTAASVNKLPILSVLYYRASQGKIDLDQRITIQQKDIQDYGTGVIRYQGAGTIYSLKTLAQLLIEKSDNTAAFVLTNILGPDTIQQVIESWGLTQTDIKNNKTSNKDMALLLTKMYKGEVANNASTQEMMGFLDDTDFENRLPALLPESETIYHKIGTEVGNIHDVGIVVNDKNPYYIGVMTNDIADDKTTEALISQISKIVYDFMSQKS